MKAKMGKKPSSFCGLNSTFYSRHQGEYVEYLAYKHFLFHFAIQWSQILLAFLYNMCFEIHFYSQKKQQNSCHFGVASKYSFEIIII